MAHEWKSDTTNIRAVSYIAMQVYKYAYTNGMLHYMSDTFPFCHGQTLSLEDLDFQIFSQLKAQLGSVVQAVKALAAARAATKKQAKKKVGTTDKGLEEE